MTFDKNSWCVLGSAFVLAWDGKGLASIERTILFNSSDWSSFESFGVLQECSGSNFWTWSREYFQSQFWKARRKILITVRRGYFCTFGVLLKKHVPDSTFSALWDYDWQSLRATKENKKTLHQQRILPRSIDSSSHLRMQSFITEETGWQRLLHRES